MTDTKKQSAPEPKAPPPPAAKATEPKVYQLGEGSEQAVQPEAG